MEPKTGCYQSITREKRYRRRKRKIVSSEFNFLSINQIESKFDSKRIESKPKSIENQFELVIMPRYTIDCWVCGVVAIYKRRKRTRFYLWFENIQFHVGISYSLVDNDDNIKTKTIINTNSMKRKLDELFFFFFHFISFHFHAIWISFP